VCVFVLSVLPILTSMFWGCIVEDLFFLFIYFFAVLVLLLLLLPLVGTVVESEEDSPMVVQASKSNKKLS
jgi:hypothetical protein